MSTVDLTKEEMISEILLNCKNSNISNEGTGRRLIPLDELLLMLAFRDESQLKEICSNLHIKTTKRVIH